METMDFVISIWLMSIIMVVIVVVAAFRNRVKNNVKYSAIKISRRIYGEQLGNYKYIEFKEIFKKMNSEDSNQIFTNCDAALVAISDDTKTPSISTLEPLLEILIKKRMNMEAMRLRRGISNPNALGDTIALLELLFLLSGNSKDSAKLLRLKYIRNL